MEKNPKYQCWLVGHHSFFLIVFLSNKTKAWPTILVGQAMSLRSYILFYRHGARRGRGDSRASTCTWRQYLLYLSVRHPLLKSKKLNFMQCTLWLLISSVPFAASCVVARLSMQSRSNAWQRASFHLCYMGNFHPLRVFFCCSPPPFPLPTASAADWSDFTARPAFQPGARSANKLASPPICIYSCSCLDFN